MSKIYKIQTIADIINKVPNEDFPMFLQDLTSFIAINRAGITTKDEDGVDTMLWENNGKNTLDIVVTYIDKNSETS